MAGIIEIVRERWWSRRAITLHIVALLFVPGCFLAAWWQITRATDGNGLSYLYAVEWPIFSILAVYFWWMFIHTDYESVGLKGMRKQAEAVLPPASRTLPEPMVIPDTLPADLSRDDVDPELADYNARLGSLASEGPKTWRKPERTVVRRSPTS
ncbi:MAG TPA: hypothetical protein VGL48_08185 [Acidimicrobiales bacterium]